MPTVFTDYGTNPIDLTITTSADWTIHSTDLANGDAAASLSTTRDENAFASSEDMCIPVGSGSEAWTLEFVVKVGSSSDNEWVCICKTNSTSTGGTNRHFDCYITSGEAVEFRWINTGGTNYLVATTSALSAGTHHVAVVVQSGSSRSVTIYVDGVSAATSSSTSGTASTAASDTYEFYAGASRQANTDEMKTHHLAHLAVYDRALSTGEISDHSLAMLAA